MINTTMRLTEITNPFTEHELERLYHGSCDIFAVALHLVSKLPLYATLDYDDDIDAVALVHSYVRDNDTIIDVYGPKSYDSMIEEFPTNDPWEKQISPEELLKIGGGSLQQVKTILPKVKYMWENNLLK